MGTFDLSRSRDTLRANLQRLTDYVGFCLRSIDANGHDPVFENLLPGEIQAALSEHHQPRVPGTSHLMHIHQPLPTAHAAAGARTWIVRGAVCDLVVLVSDFLEHLRGDLEFVAAARHDGVITGEQISDVAARLPGVLAKFNQRSLPEKLRAIESCGITFHSDLEDLTDALRSINQARNCLEHRIGRVTAKDTDEEKGNLLCVRWVAQEFNAELDDGTVVPGRAGMYMKNLHVNLRAPRERTFELGETIGFDAQDLVELAWTAAVLADEMIVAVNSEIGRRFGGSGTSADLASDEA